jgi:hypothetical protein
MRFIFLIISLSLSLSLSFLGCNPAKKLERIEKKHPELFRNDTIKKRLITNEVLKTDTLFILDSFYIDTTRTNQTHIKEDSTSKTIIQITKYKDRPPIFKFKTIVKPIFLHDSDTCESKTITKTITKTKTKTPFLSYILIVIVLILLFAKMFN